LNPGRFKEPPFTGPLEETSRPHAIAKVACSGLYRALNGQHDIEDLSLASTSLRGSGDYFDLATGHLSLALTRRLRETKQTAVDYGAEMPGDTMGYRHATPRTSRRG
jgi:hypothetical protein